jgi:hypothetical protein
MFIKIEVFCSSFLKLALSRAKGLLGRDELPGASSGREMVLKICDFGSAKLSSTSVYEDCFTTPRAGI